MAKTIQFENLRKTFGSTVAVNDLSMTIPAGEFVTLVGPSGCGKTTTLRMLAGLETPTSGKILFDDEDMTHRTPQDRPLSMVFQNIALYPHMTCRENIGYGLKIHGVSKAERDERIEEAAEILQIGDQIDKMPSTLSGGQQQRVALGRAFVEDPEVLLLDEPMSNLDAKLKAELRVEVQRLHRNLDTTIVYVTHDQNEAMMMSDRIALLRDGDLEQFAPPETIFHQPATEYAARFIGTPPTNVIECTVEDGTAVSSDLRAPLPEAAGSLDNVKLGIRPQYLSIGGGETSFDVAVDVIEPMGTGYVLHTTRVATDEAVDVVSTDIAGVSPGDTVTVGVAMGEVYCFGENGRLIQTDDAEVAEVQ